MIKKLIAFVLLPILFSDAYGCELPKGESITIGCTYECNFFYRYRLAMTAWRMGYSTNIVTIDNSLDLEQSMKKVDAILIPGGADIDPKYYTEEVTSELRAYTQNNLHLVNFSKEGAQRDPVEYEIVKTYSENESFKSMPMLGICRGLQMMSVAQGIPLYLDIKTELGIRNRMHRFDKITLLNEEESLITSIYKRNSFRGYKLHHQGIRVPYYEENRQHFPNTKLTAFSNNQKIAEVLEYTHRPALGVQYHPEKSLTSTSAPVFRWFLKKACEYKNSYSGQI